MLLGAVRPAGEKAGGLLGQLIERKKANAAQLNADADAAFERIVWLLVLVTALGVVMGLWLARHLTRQLGGGRLQWRRWPMTLPRAIWVR